MTTVTDDDRRAYLKLNMLPEKYVDAVLAGDWDSVTGVQLLAAHREAAEARARLEGAEIMREAAFRAVSFHTIPGEEAWYARDMAQDRVANLDPAAILEAHMRGEEAA